MDKYPNFAALSQSERIGVDYEIIATQREGSAVVIVAPHGGKIEPRTGEIVRAIADDDFSYYCFNGLKSANNRDLHITSHRFDEPRCVALVAAHKWVVTVHGLAARGPKVLLGGLDQSLINDLAIQLRDQDIHAEISGHQFMGREPMNICNRGSLHAGVQIELSMWFRRNDQTVAALVAAVRAALLRRTGLDQFDDRSKNRG